MYNEIKKVITLADGREIEISTGKLAKQATGSVVVKMGKTMLLATVVAADDAKEDVDFMPLSVEYKEKYSAVGRFPGGFNKREGRLSDYEILVSRLIDRALRPLFPSDFHAEVFVNVNLLSADKNDTPDALAGLAASAALTITDIPFEGPISEVRVARIDGQFKINPPYDECQRADIDMIVAATYENIMMVEGELNEVSEAEMLDAIKFAHEAIKPMCLAQKELREMCGVTEPAPYCHEVNDEDLRKKVWDETYDKAYQGDVFALYTIVHEISHWALLTVFHVKPEFVILELPLAHSSTTDAEFYASVSSLFARVSSAIRAFLPNN